MLTRLAIGVVVLGASLAPAAPAARVYVVQWSDAVKHDALTQEVDRALRDELGGRGATVVDRHRAGAIVLSTRLEVLPGALRLDVVGVRGSDRAVLGTFSLKASGASRAAQVRALAKQATLEAAQLAGE